MAVSLKVERGGHLSHNHFPCGVRRGQLVAAISESLRPPLAGLLALRFLRGQHLGGLALTCRACCRRGSRRPAPAPLRVLSRAIARDMFSGPPGARDGADHDRDGAATGSRRCSRRARPLFRLAFRIAIVAVFAGSALDYGNVLGRPITREDPARSCLASNTSPDATARRGAGPTKETDHGGGSGVLGSAPAC